MLVVIAVLLFLILCAITGTLPILGIALAIIIPIGIIGLICSGIESWHKGITDKWEREAWEGFKPIGVVFLHIERKLKNANIQYKVYRNGNRLKYKQVTVSAEPNPNTDIQLVLGNSEVWNGINNSVINNIQYFHITMPCSFLFIPFEPIKVTSSYFQYLTQKEIAQRNESKIVIPKGHWPASEDV